MCVFPFEMQRGLGIDDAPAQNLPGGPSVTANIQQSASHLLPGTISSYSDSTIPAPQ
jgi:hypothetical protein